MSDVIHLYSHWGSHKTACGRKKGEDMKAHEDYTKTNCSSCSRSMIFQNVKAGDWADVFQYAVSVLGFSQEWYDKNEKVTGKEIQNV